MNGRGGLYAHFRSFAFQRPGISRSPFFYPMVFSCYIFEVAVLYQFGIQSSVCSIVDVFEEYADELITYFFFFFWLYGQFQIHGLKAGKTGLVLIGLFVKQQVPVFAAFGKPLQPFHIVPGGFLQCTFFGHVIYLLGLLGIFAPRLGYVFFELCIGEVSLPFPVQQVIRSGMREFFSIAIQLPNAMPYALCVAVQFGFYHPFFFSPRSVITFDVSVSVPDAEPFFSVSAPGEFQSASPFVRCSGIREQVNRVGLA